MENKNILIITLVTLVLLVMASALYNDVDEKRDYNSEILSLSKELGEKEILINRLTKEKETLLNETYLLKEQQEQQEEELSIYGEYLSSAMVTSSYVSILEVHLLYWDSGEITYIDSYMEIYELYLEELTLLKNLTLQLEDSKEFNFVKDLDEAYEREYLLEYLEIVGVPYERAYYEMKEAE